MVAKFCHLHFLQYLSSLSPLHPQQVTRTTAGSSSLATLFTALTLSFLEFMLAPAPILFGCSQGIPRVQFLCLALGPLCRRSKPAHPGPLQSPSSGHACYSCFFKGTCLFPCASLSLESLLNPMAVVQKANHFACGLLTESITSS